MQVNWGVRLSRYMHMHRTRGGADRLLPPGRDLWAERALAVAQAWLGPESPLPDDATIAALVGRARRARSTISTLEPCRAQIERWAGHPREFKGGEEAYEASKTDVMSALGIER